MPSSAATTIESIAIVLYCRARYASAPCWMAFEIFCISGVPRDRDSTHRARKMANRRAIALAAITRVNSEDCVCVMLRGKRVTCVVLEKGPTRSGVGDCRALDAAPQVEHRDPDQHEHQPRD